MKALVQTLSVLDFIIEPFLRQMKKSNLDNSENHIKLNKPLFFPVSDPDKLVADEPFLHGAGDHPHWERHPHHQLLLQVCADYQGRDFFLKNMSNLLITYTSIISI